MKSFTTFGVGLLILITVVPSNKVQSQSSSIGVLDIQSVLKSSVAARSIRPQMDKLKKQYQKKFKNSETNLRQSKQDLQRERVMLPEGYAKRLKAFERRVRETQREVQTVNRMLDRALANSMRQVHRMLRDITMEVAQERLLQFVVPKSNLVFYDKRFDITKVVSERLNKRLPKVQVVMPKIRRLPAKK